MMAPEKTREEIRRILKNITAAWAGGHPGKLQEYFHDDMVIAQPGLGVRGRGKRACVDSYRQFIGQATIRGIKECDHHIDAWGDTAVASYRFEIDYRMGGQEHHDSGVDLFVFIRQEGTWLAVWRTILPLPAAGPSWR
jgi:ketosteroid isomerase-like protein